MPQATIVMRSTAAQLLLADAHLVEHEPAGVVGAPEEGVGDRVRLVVDLLLHEGGVAALLGGGGVPGDLVGLALAGRAVEADDRRSRPGVIVTIWSWPSSRACRVWPMNAATSLPRKFSPSPSPTTSGLLRRAPTTTPGLSACTARSVNAPSSRCTTLRIALVRSPTRSYSRPTSLAATSVSVSERNSTPSATQLLLQGVEVLDDAVVDQREPVTRRRRGAGARCRRWGRRGWPSGCGRCRCARGRAGRASSAERRFSSLPARFSDVDAVLGHQGHAGRVVAPVLEAGEPLHHDLEGRVVHGPADVADDSAHARQPSCDRSATDGHPRTSGGRPGRATACATMARVSATQERRTLPTPYVDLDRRAWSRLRENHPMSLEQGDLARLRGLGERLDLQRGRGGLPPAVAAAALLRRGHPRAAPRDERVPRRAPDPRAVRRRGRRLGGGRQVDDLAHPQGADEPLAADATGRARHDRRVPALQRRARTPRAVAAQGFSRVLRPSRPDALHRRGQVGDAVRRGAAVLAPHLRRAARTRCGCAGPTCSSSRGSTCCSRRPCARTARAPGRSRTTSTSRSTSTPRSRRSAPGTSSASCGCGRRRSPTRSPTSTATRGLSDDEARATAAAIWEQINEPNLVENVLPTRDRATLVLTKGADHAVTGIRLRKI